MDRLSGRQLPDYAELHCLSNFTFLRGASHPGELITRAIELGYKALAITDECSFSGLVRAHVAARGSNLKLIVGSECRFSDGFRLVILATDRSSYGDLSRLVSHARGAAEKGSYTLHRTDLETHAPRGCIAMWLPSPEDGPADGAWLRALFGNKVWIAVELHRRADDDVRLEQLVGLSERCGIPLVASGDVHMHCHSRRILQDTLTSIRFGKPLAEMGYSLFPNGERYLRSRSVLAKLYPRELLEETLKIADCVNFSLDELRYEYPNEIVPAGYSPATWLHELTYKGAERYWPEGVPEKVVRLLEHELKLIGELQYEAYFLTVHDVVDFARSQGILCQGRGSAANSAVCYCLGITAVDPSRMNLLMERFISRERDEPPDIDVDFEHERREEVIQYIYQRYGRHRAALAASVTTYRWRSAVRDVGKALGMGFDQVERISRHLHYWDRSVDMNRRLVEAGFEPQNPKIRQLVEIAAQLYGFPRHLSQHTGGFVIARDELVLLVPVENARMPDRTVIQWDKDDLETLGLIKVDILALGMLTAVRKSFDLIRGYSGRELSLAKVPAEDRATYEMIQRADTIGVFQIESRAQMSMLPRLKPANYYDLVVQVAIVRPGPIAGDMVHPYLRNRRHPERVTYPSDELKVILERTLGVPIFQEQVMQIAMVAAGFSAGEADQLRRSMAAWKKRGGLESFERRLRQGMLAKDYDDDFIRRIFKQIKGFGDYGFPESHSASFALLTYVSCWLKCHEPAAFTCALLNSQPMGFYAPAQLVQDVRRHGVEVRPVDVRFSAWESTLEAGKKHGQPSIRLGLQRIKGLQKGVAEKIVQGRPRKAFSSLQELASQCNLAGDELEKLAAAGALAGLNGDRHRAHWDVTGMEKALPVFGQPKFSEATPLLARVSEVEDVTADYRTTGMTLKRHPMALIRESLSRQGVGTAEQLWQRRTGSVAKVAGLVINRQRPLTASGVFFVTLEDETGMANLIVWPRTVEAQRVALLSSRVMIVSGIVQKEGGVLHLVVGKIRDGSSWLDSLE
ncbi:MAG: error-prone DNA polymerase [Methylococcales bacterium]|nr:error-prone DNA polymerase [Methylococcales bacterium]